MQKLFPKELKKINSKTGEYRLNILKRAIKEKISLKTTKGLVTIINNKNNQKAIDEFQNKSFSIEVIDSNNNELNIKSSDIYKSQIFGGNTNGSGGGAKLTSLVESAQCYYCAAQCYYIKNKNSNINHYNEDILKKSSIYCDTTENIDNIINDLPEDWKLSCVNTANILYKQKYISDKMTFHRMSDLVCSIYNQSKIAFKNSNYSLNSDKWNPGDIWIYNGDINDKIKLNTKNIDTLNNDIKKLFNDRKLISVSLKKIKNNPNIKLYNSGYDYQLNAKNNSILKNNKIIITYNDYKIQGRAYNHLTNWAFEIMGKYSMLGKCGLTAFINICKYHNVNIVMTKDHIMNAKNFYDLYLKYEHKNKLTYDDFIIKYCKNENFIFSKHIGLYIIDLFNNIDIKCRNLIIEDIINYASSNTRMSSTFIKVS